VQGRVYDSLVGERGGGFEPDKMTAIKRKPLSIYAGATERIAIVCTMYCTAYNLIV